MTLVPCPSCARHVRSNESACPFCSAQMGDAGSRAVPMAGRRLERLAAFTFAASLAVTGCFVAGEDTEKREDELGGIMPMYGMPPVPPELRDAGAPDAADKDGGAAPDEKPCNPTPPMDNGSPFAMYGAPAFPVLEPCPVEDAGGPMPMYGMPPHQQ